MMGGARDQWGVVWMEAPNKDLIPVRVKLGVTDFTFTEMKEGKVKVGDKLIIGQSSGKTSSTTATQGQRPPGQQGGPMGPGGVPRRF